VIDGLDSGIRIGVRRKQDAFRFRVQVDGPAYEIDTAHFRHALVGEKKRDGFVAAFQGFQGANRRGARLGPQDPVAIRVAYAQVALNGAEHLRVVINGQ
jgi:hypothetical protein